MFSAALALLILLAGMLIGWIMTQPKIERLTDAYYQGFSDGADSERTNENG